MSGEDAVAELKKRVDELEARVASIEAWQHGRVDTGRKPMSIREFILAKKPKGHVQKTLAVGYYVEQYEGISPFTATDLEQRLRKAREPIPDKIHDKIGKNIGKGHMVEVDGKRDGRKAWTLTNSGEEYVENDFKKRK